MKSKKVEDGEQTESSRIALWEVAAQSGVSVATVSRVLNNKANVSAATREKVLSCLQELKYVSRQHIDVETQAQTGLIGLTSVSMGMEPFPEIIVGVTEALHARNARPVVCPLWHRHNCGMRLQERIMQDSTDGALLLGSTDSDEELLEVYESGFPFVVVCPTRVLPEKLPVVSTTSWAGIKAATEHLLSLSHTRIAVITRRSELALMYGDDNESLGGMQSALQAARVPLLPEMIKAGLDSREGGYAVAQELLSLPDPPTAILAFSDLIALGVLCAARDRGLNVPGDLSVVGLGNLSFSYMSPIELTTVQVPWQDIGMIAVDLLYRVIDGLSLAAPRVELATRLVVRTTTGPAGKKR